MVPCFISCQSEESSDSACKKYRESVHRRASPLVTTANLQEKECRLPMPAEPVNPEIHFRR